MSEVSDGASRGQKRRNPQSQMKAQCPSDNPSYHLCPQPFCSFHHPNRPNAAWLSSLLALKQSGDSAKLLLVLWAKLSDFQTHTKNPSGEPAFTFLPTVLSCDESFSMSGNSCFQTSSSSWQLPLVVTMRWLKVCARTRGSPARYLSIYMYQAITLSSFFSVW